MKFFNLKENESWDEYRKRTKDPKEGYIVGKVGFRFFAKSFAMVGAQLEGMNQEGLDSLENAIDSMLRVRNLAIETKGLGNTTINSYFETTDVKGWEAKFQPFSSSRSASEKSSEVTGSPSVMIVSLSLRAR